MIQQKFYGPLKGNKITFQWLKYAGICDTQVGHCIFKAKYVACKITTTGFSGFFNLKQYTTFSTALVLPCRVWLVLERVLIHNPNFVVKNSSHVTLGPPCKNIILALGKHFWLLIHPKKVDEASH